METTECIRKKAIELGFDACGITDAADLADAPHMQEWLARGHAGEMRYLHDPRRTDITSVLPSARSVIACAMNYNTGHPRSTEAAAQFAMGGAPHAWISRYAWGEDYHKVILRKLESLISALREHVTEPFEARAYVDTGPIPERQVAQRAGLGHTGKNTCLIHEQMGSWLFLGVILCSLPLAPTNSDPSVAARDVCGNCTLCIDACPTGALVESYVLDARRCISYLTIELRTSVPEEFRAAMGWQVFGCDICQDVCPWNHKAPITPTSEFRPRRNLFAPELSWLLRMKEEEFREIVAGSPVRRAKWRGLIRNACIAAGNAAAKNEGSAEERGHIRSLLAELANSADAMIAEHASWALAQFDAKK